jgi:hypothetical protein
VLKTLISYFSSDKDRSIIVPQHIFWFIDLGLGFNNQITAISPLIISQIYLMMVSPISKIRERPMEVLSLGCVRTGTASIRSALLLLGYQHTYHGLDVAENWDDFIIWEKAADATFYGKGAKLNRDDWDKMLGHCCATTDITSYFAEEMISTYPEVRISFTIFPFPMCGKIL